MAASYQTQLHLELEEQGLRERVYEAARKYAEQIGAQIERTEKGARLTTPMSMQSWGERIRVEVEGKKVEIHSECKGFQIIDWGKNRANVNELVELLSVSGSELPGERGGLSLTEAPNSEGALSVADQSSKGRISMSED